MDCYTGENLLKTFQTLGINLGNTEPEVIKAWFDTDCPDAIEFLGWLCKLGRENVITATEVIQYEELVKRNEILQGDQFENAKEDVNRMYPNIFNVEDEIRECDFLEEEIARLSNEKQELENIIASQQNLNGKLCRSLTSITEEYIAFDLRKKNAEQQCLSLSQQLDAINIVSHQQLMKCSDKLKKYDCTEEPIYICHMPLDEYIYQHNDILSYMDLLVRSECNELPKLDIARKSCKKLNETIFDCDKIANSLSTLKYRLFHSIQTKNYKKMTEQRLLADIKYLKDLKKSDLNICLNNSIKIRSNILTKNSQIDILSVEIENAAKQVSENLICLPKLDFAKNETQMSKLKLQCLSEVEANFSKILSRHLLLYLMHVSHNKDIGESNEFFKTVYRYVTSNMHEIVLRTEAMQDKIKKYNKNLTLEEKQPLVKSITKILSEYQDDSTDTSAYKLINKFKNEKNHLEMKLFFDDFEKFSMYRKVVENDIKLLKSYLTDGPTAEIVVLPYALHKSFEDANNTIESLKSSVTSAMKITNDSSKKVMENKWLKMRRQLWMYFLREPQKVLSFIAEIKAKVNIWRE